MLSLQTVVFSRGNSLYILWKMFQSRTGKLGCRRGAFLQYLPIQVSSNIQVDHLHLHYERCKDNLSTFQKPRITSFGSRNVTSPSILRLRANSWPSLYRCCRPNSQIFFQMLEDTVEAVFYLYMLIQVVHFINCGIFQSQLKYH